MAHQPTEGVSVRAASAIAVLVATYAGLVAAHPAALGAIHDIDQLWFAAHALLDGRDPYALIGPGREFDYPWPLLYPLPAVLALVPLAHLPVEVARIAIVSVPSGALAYWIARTEPAGLVIFLSRAFYLNAWYSQWTPLLMCLWFVPAAGVFVAAKPTVGAVMLAGSRDWRKARTAGLWAAGFLLLSLVVRPSWPAGWLGAVNTADHIRPWVAAPGGFLLLLALIRWRRWEGRILVACALIPQTPHTLATLPVLLLPGPWWGKALLSALTFLPGELLLRAPFAAQMAMASMDERFRLVGAVTLWTVLLPALAFVVVDRRTGDGSRHP